MNPKTIEVPEELVWDTLQELRLLRKSIWGQELVRLIERLESLLANQAQGDGKKAE